MCHQITDVTVRPFLHLLHPTRKPRRELQIPGRDVSDPRWLSSVDVILVQLRGCRYDACFVAASLNQDGQSDPRQLVGKRDGQNVAVQTPRRNREPGSKTVLCPALRSEQNGAGALDEELPIAVSALRDAAKDRAITGRHLFRHQAKPSGKVSPFREGSSIADRSYRGACNDRADARNRGRSTAGPSHSRHLTAPRNSVAMGVAADVEQVAQVSNCQQINATPTTPTSTRPTKFIQKIVGCVLRTIRRSPRARNEPSRNTSRPLQLI